nr:hypothetical protein CFP56_41750 [Quercus suber]
MQRQAEEQLEVAKEQIEAQEKEMEKVEEVAAQAKQNGYDIGVWTEELNLAGVGASSELRRTENIFYPPALRVVVQPSSQVATAPKVPKPS